MFPQYVISVSGTSRQRPQTGFPNRADVARFGAETGSPNRADVARFGAERDPARGKAGFSRERRLLKHADFDRVYRQGQRHFSGHMTVFYLRRELGTPRVGFTVGRLLGGAVQRNRIRRRLREAVRRRFSALSAPVDVVINPKKSVLSADFSVLLDEVGSAFGAIARRMSQ